MANDKKDQDFRPNRMTRRSMLRSLSLAAAGGVALGVKPFAKPAWAQGAPAKKPRFLIVIGAMGGASIIDSFLAIRGSESANAANINTFPDAEVLDVAGSPFR